jgi:hypothetical protein
LIAFLRLADLLFLDCDFAARVTLIHAYSMSQNFCNCQ